MEPAVILLGLAVIALFVLGVLDRRNARQAMELLASRSFPEYAAGKQKLSAPRALTEAERAAVALEERMKDAENDPYAQG